MAELSKRFPVTATYVSHAENSDYGNHIDYSKNMYLCFDTANCEDSAYLYDSHHNKNCYDLTQSFHSEFSYEVVDSVRLNQCFFMSFCNDLYNSGFCYNCGNGNHLFGCVSLEGKEYCILNKKCSPEEYEKLVGEIMASFNFSLLG